MIGIYLMGFVIAVSGIGALGTAIAYAVRPSDAKLALMRPLSIASIFAAICSFSVGTATALKFGAEQGLSGHGAQVLVAGLSEALVPLFVAFAFLSVAWLFIAVGLRRHASLG